MKHPKSVAAGLGGAIAVITIAIITTAGGHPSPELSAAITTVASYAASLLPNG